MLFRGNTIFYVYMLNHNSGPFLALSIRVILWINLIFILPFIANFKSYILTQTYLIRSAHWYLWNENKNDGPVKQKEYVSIIWHIFKSKIMRLLKICHYSFVKYIWERPMHILVFKRKRTLKSHAFVGWCRLRTTL